METLIWLYNSIPWQGTAVITVVVIGVIFYFLWPVLPKWAKEIILAIGALVVFAQYFRNKGKEAAENKRKADDAKAIQTRDKIRNDVKGMSSSDVDRDLERNGWMRRDE